MGVTDKTVINGNEGTLQAVINGRVEELGSVKEFEALITYIKKEIRAIGQRMVGHKVTGLSGDGDMSVYYNSHIFRRVADMYRRTGVFPEISLVCTNLDPATVATTGHQTVVLRGVKPDSVILAKLAEDDELEEDFSFTFEDYEFLDTFRG